MSNRVRQQLEKAILFIESHLQEKLTAPQIAEHACISVFHFQRLFHTYMGEPLAQYVLHRRLELAAKKLTLQKNVGIADIAFQSGFETHSSFSRAFKSHFKVSPSAFRDDPNSAELANDFRRLLLKTKPSTHTNIEVNIETLPTLWLNHKPAAGKIYGSENKQNFSYMNQDMQTLLDANKPELFGLATSCSSVYSGRPQRLEENASSLIYGAIYKDKQDNDWSDEWFEMGGGLWAVCTHDGLQEHTYQTWNSLLRSWLPKSDYELRDTIHFGYYTDTPDMVHSNKTMQKKIYLPIQTAESEH